MEIRSVNELLEGIRVQCSGAMMFRGQTQDWPLVPSIGRYVNIVGTYENWRVFHEYLISQYKRLGRPYIGSLDLSETDIWIHGQHHGLPTRLLDWSTNPLKALFFCLDKTADDEADGILWALSFSSWREELDNKYRSIWEDELVAFMPDQSNVRLTHQEGCFLSYPLPENCNSLIPVDKLGTNGGDQLTFVKFVIPADAKNILRHELAVLGIRYRLLFPDIVGVTKGIVLEELTP